MFGCFEKPSTSMEFAMNPPMFFTFNGHSRIQLQHGGTISSTSIPTALLIILPKHFTNGYVRFKWMNKFT
jgi:hypothetical protein